MKNSVKDKVEGFFERNFPIWLIVIGVCLRLKHFLDNRSLWLDEAYIGIYVRVQHWGDIFLNRAGLEDTPVPPMGFMVFEKIAAAIGGNNEFALRFFPLVFGCAAIIVFFQLAKRILPRAAAVFALGLFVFSDTLIYFSAEAKHYSLELLTALVFWLFFLVPEREGKSDRRKGLWLPALLGIFAILCSHQIVFIMASYVLAELWVLIKEKRQADFYRFLVVCFSWGVVWIFFFMAAYSRMISSRLVMGDAEAACFLPLSGWMEALRWLWKTFAGLFKNPGGLFGCVFPMILFVIGGASLWKRDKRTVLLLVLPFVFVLAASALRKYPVYGRLLMFCAPTLFFLIAQGAWQIAEKAGRRYRKIVLCGLAVLVLAVPVREGLRNFVTGRIREESRDLICFMKEHFRQDDLIVMNYFGMRPFFYYFARGKAFSKLNIIFVTNGLFEKGRNRYVALLEDPVYFVPEANFYLEKDGERGEEKIVKEGAVNIFLKGQRRRRAWTFFFHHYDSKEIVLDLLKRSGFAQKFDMKRKAAELYVFESE